MVHFPVKELILVTEFKIAALMADAEAPELFALYKAAAWFQYSTSPTMSASSMHKESILVGAYH